MLQIVPLPGERSIDLLAATLASHFGQSTIRWSGQTGPGVDAIGWRLAAAPRYLFSASTHAGELPEGQYDVQVSIIDDTLDYGEIILLAEVDLKELCSVTQRFASGEVIERID